MLFEIIKETNGDILGVILFILLIWYFIQIDDKNLYEYILLLGCCMGFIVDIFITLNFFENFNS
jgi:uncharacterized membrane protein